jgi:hypothetical protein
VTRPVSAQVKARAGALFTEGRSEREVARLLGIGAGTAHRLKGRVQERSGGRGEPAMPAADPQARNGHLAAATAVALQCDPRPDTDGDNPDIAQLRLEMWTRTGRVIGADAAMSLGQALMPSGPPDCVSAVLANRPAGEYVRQVVVPMPADDLATLAGVVAVLPARPTVAVPDPEHDGELGKLAARRAARADRLEVWEPRAAEARPRRGTGPRRYYPLQCREGHVWKPALLPSVGCHACARAAEAPAICGFAAGRTAAGRRRGTGRGTVRARRSAAGRAARPSSV